MDAFIIPKNEDEFIEFYLDKSVYGEQIARCDILHRAMTNNLTAAEYRIHKLNGSVELFDKEYRQLKEQLFKAAIVSFASKLCTEQRNICESAYYNAPCCEEGEYITEAAMPDLCEDINAYNEAEKWWKSLSTQEMLDLATVFESEFGILNHNEVSDEAEVELYDKWAQIPIDDRHRIFLIVTKSE